MIVTGTNFTGATSIQFGTVPASQHHRRLVDRDRRRVAERGRRHGRYHGHHRLGDSPTSPADEFTYESAPTVTGISPPTGPPGGGTSVTITGAGFTAARRSSFGTSAAHVHLQVVRPRSQPTSPAGPAGTVDVTVTTPAGTSANGRADPFIYEAVPTVTGVNPARGRSPGAPRSPSRAPGSPGPATGRRGAVRHGNPAAMSRSTPRPRSPPAGARSGRHGRYHRHHTAGTSATSNADQFSFEAVPTVTAVTPAAGCPPAGPAVTITGTYLNGATAVVVRHNGRRPPSRSSPPPRSPSTPGPAGTVDVTVTTPGGTSATSAADQFTYQPVPTVTAISPTPGTRLGAG